MSLNDSADGRRTAGVLPWHAWLDDDGKPIEGKKDDNYRHAAVAATMLTDALRRSGFTRG